MAVSERLGNTRPAVCLRVGEPRPYKRARGPAAAVAPTSIRVVIGPGLRVYRRGGDVPGAGTRAGTRPQDDPAARRQRAAGGTEAQPGVASRGDQVGISELALARRLGSPELLRILRPTRLARRRDERSSHSRTRAPDRDALVPPAISGVDRDVAIAQSLEHPFLICAAPSRCVRTLVLGKDQWAYGPTARRGDHESGRPGG